MSCEDICEDQKITIAYSISIRKVMMSRLPGPMSVYSIRERINPPEIHERNFNDALCLLEASGIIEDVTDV